jgi:DNA-binding SARP family transcriptional activator
VPEDHALASLRTSLWRLNRSVRALVTPHGPSLRLSPSAGLDTREQELVATRLLREHRDDVEWLERQLPRLWPRDLLPGWYDDWVVVERERLNQLRLHALEHAAALLTAHHRLDSALDVALEAVRTEPLRETANEQLIRVHLARGNVYDAVRQYQLYRGILHRDLGVAPSPHLARLVSSRCARGVVPRQRSADVGVTSR